MAVLHRCTGVGPAPPMLGHLMVRDCGRVVEHYDVGVRLGEKVAKDMIAVRIGRPT